MRHPPEPTGTRSAARTAALVVTAVLLLGCQERPPRVAYDLVDGAAAARLVAEIVTLDVGSPASRPHLVEGFSWSERAGDGRTFSWSAGSESIARFELFSTAPRSVALRGFPFDAPGAASAQRVEVRLNGALLGVLTLDTGLGTSALDVPSEALRLGTNELSLRYSHTHRSRAGPRLGRDIAVAWDALALLPAGPVADAAARLDAALATLASSHPDEVVARPPIGRRGLLLQPGNALRFTLDVGPGALLRLDDVRFPAPRSGPLAVWLDLEEGAPRPVAEVAAPAGSLTAALAVERFDTVRLTIAAGGGDGRATEEAIRVGGARVVYPFSPPSASPGAPDPAARRAAAAPPP
jgi:hypothetical protein